MRQKATAGMPLHQSIAGGMKLKDFKGSKGINSKTIPGIK